MAKDTFTYPESRQIIELLDATARRSGVSRGQAFADFLHMSLCALSGGEMEGQYLEVVEKHTRGEPGQRGCDSIAAAFGELVIVMERTRADILGDIFQGAITRGEAGQYLTPEPVCEAMARLTLEATDDADERQQTVCDPCCGSGRLLLAAAKARPGLELIGQDIDVRCVRMTAINLALRNLYGSVIWGDSLANERRLVYRTGYNLQGFVREVASEEAVPAGPQRENAPAVPQSTASDATAEHSQQPKSAGQLYLF